jgi:ferredoxin
VAATATPAAAPNGAGAAASKEKADLADQWNDLFAIDDDDKASYVDPDTGEEVKPAAAPKKSDNQAKWDDLFAIDDDDKAVVLTDEELAQMRAAGSLPPSVGGNQPVAAANGNGNGNGNGHSEELPVLYAPPKPRASADGDKWAEEMGVDGTAAILMPDGPGDNSKVAGRKS